MFHKKKTKFVDPYNGFIQKEKLPSVEFDEFQRLEFELIEIHIRRWMIANGYLQKHPKSTLDTPIILGHTAKIAELKHADSKDVLKANIYTASFSSFRNQKALQQFIEGFNIQSGTFRELTRIQDLYIDLLVTFKPSTITLCINKFLVVMDAMTHDIKADEPGDVLLSWYDIFQAFPYIWVIYLIHREMNKFPVISSIV